MELRLIFKNENAMWHAYRGFFGNPSWVPPQKPIMTNLNVSDDQFVRLLGTTYNLKRCEIIISIEAMPASNTFFRFDGLVRWTTEPVSTLTLVRATAA
jgi:hypothetical protein